MERFTKLTGVAVPLMRANIDTDVIIPIDRMIGHDRKDLGRFAFEALRYLDRKEENPDFVLNRRRGAKILIAGPNFGCGSSREGAVWALWEYGIRCVIAPSFGDIFFNNCFKNGLLPIVLPAARVEELARQVAAAPEPALLTVDLERRVIQTADGGEVAFEVAAAEREALLAGLDPIGMTLTRERDIAAFQARDRERRPWIYAG